MPKRIVPERIFLCQCVSFYASAYLFMSGRIFSCQGVSSTIRPGIVDVMLIFDAQSLYLIVIHVQLQMLVITLIHWGPKLPLVQASGLGHAMSKECHFRQLS